jgi:hypothetical protein
MNKIVSIDDTWQPDDDNDVEMPGRKIQRSSFDVVVVVVVGEAISSPVVIRSIPHSDFQFYYSSSVHHFRPDDLLFSV